LFYQSRLASGSVEYVFCDKFSQLGWVPVKYRVDFHELYHRGFVSEGCDLGPQFEDVLEHLALTETDQASRENG
jgi:hypothetical protein